MLTLIKQKKTKQKQKNLKNQKEKPSVKHPCQVASPGGRSLSTEFGNFFDFAYFCLFGKYFMVKKGFFFNIKRENNVRIKKY